MARRPGALLAFTFVALANAPIGVVRIDGTTGDATLTTARLGAGLHTLDASYADVSGLFDPATSPALTQKVVPAATTTTLTTSQNPVAPGTPLTLGARVDVNPPADRSWLAGFGGALRFSVNGAQIGPSLSLGDRYVGFDVTVVYPAVAAVYKLGASYGGDANSGASSAVLEQVVQAAVAPPVGGAPAAPATAPALSAQLRAASGALVTALRHGGLAALTRTTAPFSAPGPGVLEQRVYTPDAPASALKARPRATLIAAARRSFAAAGSGRLRLTATRAGRRAIRRARSLRLAIVARFTPPNAAPVTVVNRLTVKAKARSPAFARAGATGGWRLVAIRPTP